MPIAPSMALKTTGRYTRKPNCNSNSPPNYLLLNEKAIPRVTNSCKSYPDISLASSSTAINIDWHTEYAVGSESLPTILSIICDLITHTKPHRYSLNIRKADWTSNKDDIELKLKKGQRPTNVYHAKRTSRKATNTATGRYIRQ